VDPDVRAPVRQRGVALLIALLVVALATVLIAGLLDRAELTAARTRNVIRGEQADAFALGLEAYAARVLLRDLEQGQFDANGDLWSLPLPPTPVPGGTISATMRDLNGCFNLNNLAPDNPNAAVWRDRFRRLLQAVRLDPSLAATVIDWIDADGDAGDGGAEDGAYLAQNPPYRTANRRFVHVSELRLLRGFDGKAYAAIEPHVCALPAATDLNLNTATVPVLMTLATGVTEQVARRIWRDGQARYARIEEVLQELIDQRVLLDESQRVGLSVTSRYFLARGEITLDDLPFARLSLIDRKDGVRVLQRSRAE
jgi:general secretion pathway protein K